MSDGSYSRPYAHFLGYGDVPPINQGIGVLWVGSGVNAVIARDHARVPTVLIVTTGLDDSNIERWVLGQPRRDGQPGGTAPHNYIVKNSVDACSAI